MRSIFISYRRGDTEGQAGRLFDDLVAQFGKTAVFMDVEDIEPGRDFRKVIDQHVSSCGVLLALVGKGWLDATDHEGHRRLDDPNDFVRLETASALKRDIPVIPVLVQGAAMPKADSLPDDLKEFAFRNAVELTHARWESDVQLLIRALGRYVDTGEKNEQPVATSVAGGASAKASGKSTAGTDKQPEEQHAAATSASPQGKKSWIPALVAAIIAIALSAGGYIMYDNTKKAAEEHKLGAQKAAIDRLATEKAAEEQRVAAAKAAEERARAEQAVEEEKRAARDRAERAEAERIARERRERAEADRIARERSRQRQNDNSNVTTGGRELGAITRIQVVPRKRLNVRAVTAAPSVGPGGKSTIYVTVTDEVGHVVTGATVLIEAGGGKFLENAKAAYDPKARLHGPFSVSGKTESNGAYTAWWVCSPCARGYVMSVSASKEGCTDANGKLTVNIK